MLPDDKNRYRLNQIVLLPHDAAWHDVFVEEAGYLTVILGNAILDIQHTGSTSIPGIVAKPILDITIEVNEIAWVDEATSTMEDAGYISLGENGISGRRFFIRRQGDVRKCNIHIFPTGHPEIAWMLDFRDYLRAHPEAALEYEQLKHELALKFPNDIDSYSMGKSEFVKNILSKAKQQ
jgi:GrpB-like predicted nucleotidyltransferase (UPF0157 family)